jgi:hypothetical protein
MPRNAIPTQQPLTPSLSSASACPHWHFNIALHMPGTMNTWRQGKQRLQKWLLQGATLTKTVPRPRFRFQSGSNYQKPPQATQMMKILPGHSSTGTRRLVVEMLRWRCSFAAGRAPDILIPSRHQQSLPLLACGCSARTNLRTCHRATIERCLTRKCATGIF